MQSVHMKTLLLDRCNASAIVASSTRMSSSTEKTGRYPFKIPAPIERSPTDLLQALSDTTKKDETNPPYALVDDPFMIPTNVSQKKYYLLSKEYGIRTARRLVAEWPTLFMFDRDQPRLGAFRPQKPLNPQVVEATEANLTRMLADRQIKDAIQFYEERLRPKDEKTGQRGGAELSTEVKMELFRLLCYYNADDPHVSEWAEWEWFASRAYFSSDGNNPRPEWKSGSQERPSLAEELFQDLPKTDETYSALICGICKFTHQETSPQLRMAKQLYDEMTASGMVPHEEVFNFMLRRRIPLMSDAGDNFDPLEWLAEMTNRFAVRPSIHTFNAAFSTLRREEEPETNNQSTGQNEQLDEENADTEVAADAGETTRAEVTAEATTEAEDSTASQSEEPLQAQPNPPPTGQIIDDEITNEESSQSAEAAANDSKESTAKKLSDCVQTLLGQLNCLGLRPSLSIYEKVIKLVPHMMLDAKVNLLHEALTELEYQLNIHNNNNGKKEDNKTTREKQQQWNRDKGSDLHSTDSDDHTFFFTGMDIAVLANNEQLLDRVVAVYKHESNFVKIPNPLDETKFYNQYLQLKMETLPLQLFLVLYKAFVPNLTGLDFITSFKILNEMQQRKPHEFCWPLLQRLVQDIIASQKLNRHRIAANIMRQLRDINATQILPPTQIKEYFSLCDQVLELLGQIDAREEYNAERKRMKWAQEKTSERS